MSNYVTYPKESEVLEELLKLAAEKSEKAPKQNKSEYDVIKEVDEYVTLEEMSQKAHPSNFNILDSMIDNGGVVEDSFEMQEKAIDIINDAPTNIIVYKKADTLQSISKELVAIAEEMEVRDQPDLAIFADSIFERIVKKNEIKKEALGPLAMVGIGVAAAGALLGGYYLIQNQKINYGLEGNITALINKINEYLTEKLTPVYKEVGSSVVNNVMEILYGLIDKLNKLNKNIERYNNISQKYIADIQSITRNSPQIIIDENKLEDKSSELANQISQAREVATKLNKITDLYTNYLKSNVLPDLTSTKIFLSKYLESIKSITLDKPQDSSFWSKTKEFFDKKFSTDFEGQMLEMLDNIISSVNSEIKIKSLEKDRLIEQNKPKVERNLQSEYENMMDSMENPPPQAAKQPAPKK